MKQERGQAMTEFIIILPVLILIIACGLQLLMICRAKIQLSEVEREVMRAIAADEPDKRLKAIAMQCALAYGMKQENISLNDENGRPVRYSIRSAAAGQVFILSYDYPLSGLMKKAAGKDTLKLTTRLFSPAGGCFKNPEKSIMDILWKSMPGF